MVILLFLALVGDAACLRLGPAPSMLANGRMTKKPPAKLGGRGFGAAPPTSGKLLDEPRYTALYEWLRSSPLTNLKKVGIAEFEGGLRGVMALQDIMAGEEIVAIPATLAIDLGADGVDPLPAARRFLGEMHGDTDGEYAAYWAVLPPPDAADLCTPDFFSEKELQMLQWPPLVVETRKRSAQLRKALGERAPNSGTPNDVMAVAGGNMRELRWAVWTILSRVLTVADPTDLRGHKLLIPLIDMFNHRGGSKHYLTGRTDGMLRVVAGATVKAGEQIFIKYGTDQTSNVEFVAHYGFVDPKAETADRTLLRMQPTMVPALKHSTLAQDEAELDALKAADGPYQEQLALGLRMALKRAALKEGLLEA